jgi:adenylate cyclase
MARLVLSTPEGQQVVDLRPINSLGRHPNNSIQLLDKIVSKEHCIVEQRGDIFVLRDLGSLNGTYINGSRVNGEQALRGGDEITMGGTRARFDDGTTSGLGNGGSIPPPANSAQGQPPASGWAPAMPPSQAAPQSFPGGPVPSAGGYGAQPGGYPPNSFPGQAGPATAPLPGPGAGAGAGGIGSPVHRQAASTRIEVQAQDRAIGTQIAAEQKGFLPFESIAGNAAQLRDDYERLRLSHELSREIAMERDTTRLLEKVLASVFKITRADRGVIFLKDESGVPQGMVSRRRDGSDVPITVSSTIMNKVMQERTAVLTHDAAMDFSNAKGRSMILNRISSAIVAPFIYKDEVLGILWIDSESLAMFQPKDLELVTAIANQAAMFIEINILGRKIEDEIVTRERMSRLLSPNIAERIVSGALTIQKGGSLVKECTVFNSDIRGFTRMSEGTAPQAVVEMLNEYFEEMVDSIFKHEGTLDKFMGDGIMAIWGAPVAHNDDALRSVASSLEQMELLGQWNRKRGGSGHLPIAVGIGIHTGELVAGYVGSSRALSYTVIGDTVNTSARLCGIAQAGQIVVSETTYARLGGRFEVEEMPPAKLKGKERPLRIYNVIRERPMAQVPGQLVSGADH